MPRHSPKTAASPSTQEFEDVGRRGLEAALRPSDRERLGAWRKSDRDAWLFIDFVDEAKDSGIKLRVALQRVAESIAGAERRAHVVLSGRYTDWQFRRDLEHLNEELAIPVDQALPPPPSPDDLVISTIHHEFVKEGGTERRAARRDHERTR